jgi:N-ethylmaleimide reductase
MADLQLLTPTELGALELPNRVVMAPLTRNRAGEGRVPTDLHVEYYRQRASAGLVVTEATVVSPQAVGYDRTPGIWNDEQVAAWKRVTDAVHEDGGRIVLQLWHTGRVSHTAFHDGEPPVSSTDQQAEAQVFADGGMVEASKPRRLRTDELPGIVEDFAAATRNAREAGFDGVEVHAGNGYLLEQFLAAGVNDRDDEYGGSPQARAKFPLEVVQAVVDAWSADRVGLRLSLGNGTFDAADDDPIPTLREVADGVAPLGLAYVHLIEEFSRSAEGTESFEEDPRTTLLREQANAPVLVNGGYDRATGESAIQNGRATAVVYGKPFISNPDLVERFQRDAELNEWDESTFYGGGAEGYTDYPTLDES